MKVKCDVDIGPLISNDNLIFFVVYFNGQYPSKSNRSL